MEYQGRRGANHKLPVFLQSHFRLAERAANMYS